MQVVLSDDAKEWQRRARAFADECLVPHEVHAEMHGGEPPDGIAARNKARAIELGLPAMDVPVEHGGLGLPMQVQVAVWEALGRVTNALCWCFAEPQRWMFDACDVAQIERYVLPLMRGERHDCYAITEEGPGSDVAAIRASAERTESGYRLNGEKWYVTSANLADFYWFQARLDGEATLFFVDHTTPGIETIANPAFSHTFAAHHPTVRFRNVDVPETARIGTAGGMDYSREWFRRERVMIAARCCGAAARLIEAASEFAIKRSVGGERLADKQLIQAMLADSATELYAARLMTFATADAHDAGQPLSTLHARASMAKLYASEMAGRVADRALQIFGGRGYMRENVAERFSRELRVDRIWEGTSEIQRLIIAGCLLKRGLDGL